MKSNRSGTSRLSSPPPARRAAGFAGARALAAAIAAIAAFASGCALPGRPTPILPELSGRIFGGDAAADLRVQLVVVHRETPSLHARREFAVDRDGRFRFEPILLEVAGHEFSKHYRVHLHLRSGDADRVIWRADVSRLDAPRPIPLDCDLARPAVLGEVCRVRDPLDQPWLLAEGAKSFERLCADCHGIDGRGAEADAKNAGERAQPAPPDLTRIAVRAGGRFDPDRVAAWIEGRSLPASHARGDMPVWGERLSAEFALHAEGDELIGATLDPLLAHLERLQEGIPAKRERPAD